MKFKFHISSFSSLLQHQTKMRAFPVCLNFAHNFSTQFVFLMEIHRNIWKSGHKKKAGLEGLKFVAWKFPLSIITLGMYLGSFTVEWFEESRWEVKIAWNLFKASPDWFSRLLECKAVINDELEMMNWTFHRSFSNCFCANGFKISSEIP